MNKIPQRLYPVHLRISSFLAVVLAACGSPKQADLNLNFHVESADDWSNLFIRQDGWFGGDGIFAIPLNRDTSRQLIIFSDTMLGLIKDGKLQKGYHMINNSVAYLDGSEPLPSRIDFPVPKDSSGSDRSIFPNKLEEAEEGEYFWLGDGFRNPATDAIHIFAYRVIDRPESTDVFKFEVLGGAIITIAAGSEFPYDDQEQINLPFFQNNGGWVTSFGAGVMENIGDDGQDGHIYIYGIRDPNKQVLVARVMPGEFLNFDTWKFWDGKVWMDDFTGSVALADSASNELSVNRLPNGQYAMIFQESGIYPRIGMRLGDSPYGPFGAMDSIWNCSEALKEKEFFTYNAKAHPTLSKSGELLVSYNVNSFDFWNQIESYPNLYRPRFIRLIFH